MDPRIPSLTDAAAAAFGGEFRYTEEFSTSWIYQQIGKERGRRVSQEVRALYDGVWASLDSRYPERVIQWPQWPAARALTHQEAGLHCLGRTKPLTKDVICSMYSPQAVRIAAKTSGNEDELFDRIYRNPPLQMDMTWTRKEKKRGLKTRDETWPENKEHEAKREKTLLQIFVAPSTPALPVEVVPEVFRFDYGEQVVISIRCMLGDCAIASQVFRGIRVPCAKDLIFRLS